MAGKELINKIRKKGICGTIKMIAVKWKKTERDLWNPPISRVRKDLIDRILRRGYSRIVIYENHFGYHNIMMQRPQHMLRNMGDEETLILYNSYYDIDFKDRRRITPIARHVYVLDLYYYRKYLLNALKQIEKYIRRKYYLYAVCNPDRIFNRCNYSGDCRNESRCYLRKAVYWYFCKTEVFSVVSCLCNTFNFYRS